MSATAKTRKRVFLWSINYEEHGGYYQCHGDTAEELFADLVAQVTKHFPGRDQEVHRVYVSKARYADPANDFDIVDFFEDQQYENMNIPGEEDWITYGVPLEECKVITAEIQAVIRKHFKRLNLDTAFAWCEGEPAVVVWQDGKPTMDISGFAALGFEEQQA